MKKKIYGLFCLVALLSMATACNDKMEIPQHGVLDLEGFYQTDEQIASADYDMYSNIISIYRSFALSLNSLGDDCWAAGGGRGDNTILERMNEYTFDAESDHINNMFSSFYTLIFKANVVLGRVNPEGGKVAQQVRADAKLFRAWAYFYLTALWGNPPLVDHELKQDEYWQPNTPAAEVWAFVEKDLTEAISSGALAEKSSVNDTQWRLTKQLAQALLGKAYIWQKKYSEAAKILDEVIESGKYDLFTAGEYGDMNRIQYKHNCETMMEINRPFDTANPGLSSMDQWVSTGPRTDRLNGYQQYGIPMGWGFLSGQRSLYDAFVAREGKDGYRLNQSIKTIEAFNKMGITVKEGNEITGEGVFFWKDRALTEECVGGGLTKPGRDIVYLRFAEVLLLAAEAHLNGGSAEKALKYVNRIRTRARLPELASVTMDDVKIEKRLELCRECTRYMDLVRWGDAPAALGNQGAYMPFVNDKGEVRKQVFNNDPSKFGFKTGKHELLPYPASEIRTNKNIKQNPGY